MRCLLAWLALSAACLGQLPNPLQPMLDFDAAYDAATATVDFKALTDVQRDEQWKEIDKKIMPAIKSKPWRIVLKVKEVTAGENNSYEIEVDPNIPLQGSVCQWSLRGDTISLKIPKATAEKIHKGDYLEFIGVPMKKSTANTAAQNNEVDRRINKALALQLLVTANKSTSDVILVDVKPQLPK